MTDREIRVGDYVKTKHGVGRVIGGGDIRIGVEVPKICVGIYWKKNVAPVNKRTAFLSRLGALLKEFDADIIASQSDLGEVSLYINVDGDDTVGYCDEDSYFILNADNIMDFEKE